MVKIAGGDKLAGYLRDLTAKLTNSNSVEVGFFMGDKEDNGTPIPVVAAIMEFGAASRRIPPRPFFRNMISKKSSEWPKAVSDLLKANDFDAAKTLDQIGVTIEAELRQSIFETNDPPLSDVTVMLRGMRSKAQFRDLPFHERLAIAVERVRAGKTNYSASAKPLVDTGAMLANVKHVVK